MKRARLPLGVDIGTTRIRVEEAEMTPAGPRVRAVAVRDVASAEAGYVCALIDDAVRDLGTKERRCGCALGEPDAVMRPVPFPKMPAAERERSARFEAQRFVDFPVEEAVVRVHAVERPANLWAVGVARQNAVFTRVHVLRGARLRPLAIDHEACALLRALPAYDAILDVGHQRSSLHVRTTHAPVTLQAFNGGADVTRAIERELSIDERTAEKRKRILGTAGAGERARAALAADITALVSQARRTHDIARIALTGNGARLPGLASDLESSTGAFFEIPVCEVLRGDSYPEDVMRSGAPDWTLAAGLSLWSRP